MLIPYIFSLSHNVFYPKKMEIFILSIFVLFKCIEFGHLS